MSISKLGPLAVSKSNSLDKNDKKSDTGKKPETPPSPPVDRIKNSGEAEEPDSGRGKSLSDAFKDAFKDLDDAGKGGLEDSGKFEKDSTDKSDDSKGSTEKPGSAEKPPGDDGPPDRASEEEIREAIDDVAQTGDLDALDTVDYFRESLPPDQQEIYDQQLEELREDERIEFETDPRLQDQEYLDSLTPEEREYAESLLDNPEAYEDLFLRGFLASTFGDPERRDEAIERAGQNRGLESTEGAGDHEEVDGKFEVRLGVENLILQGEDGESEALAYANGGAISANVVATVRTLATPGDQGIPAHEFEHILNGPKNEEAVDVPEDVSNRDSERLLELYRQANPSKEIDEAHVYTDVLNDFLSDPHALAEESPELYTLVADIQGYDPVAGIYPKPERGGLAGILDKLGDLFGF